MSFETVLLILQSVAPVYEFGILMSGKWLLLLKRTFSPDKVTSVTNIWLGRIVKVEVAFID